MRFGYPVASNLVIPTPLNTTVRGGQLKAVSGQSLQPISTTLLPSDLGTGATGAVTLTATATLTRTVDYTTLTIDANVTLAVAGYVVRCTGTMTVIGTVSNNGENGDIPHIFTGGTPVPGAPTGALQGGADGVRVTASVLAKTGIASPLATIQGGPGGAAEGYAGGAEVNFGPMSPSFQSLHSASISGGGSGACVISRNTGANSASGGAGGPVVLMANRFDGTGIVQSKAGTGYRETPPGLTTIVSIGGSGGGPVIVACRTNSFAGTLESLGAPAIIFRTGAAALPGSDGRVVVLLAT